MNNWNFLTIFLFSSVFLLSSCDDDDDSGHMDDDQSLQGIIGGKNWQASSGTANPDHFGDDGGEIEYLITNQIDNVCGHFDGTGDVYLYFSVPNQVGVYELSSSRFLELVDLEHIDVIHFTVTSGSVEILTIDASEGGTVTGRIVAKYDEENFVNGNFIATYCP